MSLMNAQRFCFCIHSVWKCIILQHCKTHHDASSWWANGWVVHKQSKAQFLVGFSLTCIGKNVCINLYRMISLLMLKHTSIVFHFSSIILEQNPTTARSGQHVSFLDKSLNCMNTYTCMWLSKTFRTGSKDSIWAALQKGYQINFDWLVWVRQACPSLTFPYSWYCR